MIGRRGLAALLALLTAVGASGCTGEEQGVLTVVVATPEQKLTGAARATFEVDYSGTGASILDADGSPDCAFILPGIDGDFADDGQGKLTIRAEGPRATRGGADIAACRMKAGDPESTADDVKDRLTVRLAGAEDAAGKAVDVAAATVRPTAKAAGRSEAEVQAAQAEAVRAAEQAAASSPRPTPAPDATAGAAGMGAAGAAGPGAAGARPAPPSAAAGPAASAARNAAAASAAASAAKNAAAAQATARATGVAGNQGGAAPDPTPAPVDKDPGYDDSESQNDRVQAYTLTISTIGSSVMGALQFTVTHLGGKGGFIGRGDGIDCVPLVDAIFAGNYVGERNANFGLISVQGMPPSGPILRCGFRTSEPLSPASFQIQVTDSSDTESNPLDPAPSVLIGSVTPR